LAFNPFFYQFGFWEILQSFYVGLLFDFSAIIYTNAIIILLIILPFKFRAANWYQNVVNIIFYSINGIAVLVNLIDTAYFKFSGKRSGVELLKMTDELTGVWKNYLLDYWYLLIILAAIIYLLFKINKSVVSNAKFDSIIYNRK